MSWNRYQTYISSAIWHSSEARREELRRADYRCRLCNRGTDEVRLEVHHRTYARLGRERPEDLTTLCADCHALYTGHARRQRYAQWTLVLTDVPRLPPARFPADQIGAPR